MPKLNKCPYRQKVNELIGQRRDGFHFGYYDVIYCNRNGEKKKCCGMVKCNYYPEVVKP